MRGTFAVIAIVLLVVLSAHLQRERTQQDAELEMPAIARHSSGGCGAATPEDDVVPDAPAVVATAATSTDH